MEEKNRFCWKLVTEAIMWEYRIINEHERVGPRSVEEEKDFKYAVGSYNAVQDYIEFLKIVCEVDVIERAEQYSEDRGVPMEFTVEMQESDMDPNPRLKGNHFKAYDR